MAAMQRSGVRLALLQGRLGRRQWPGAGQVRAAGGSRARRPRPEEQGQWDRRAPFYGEAADGPGLRADGPAAVSTLLPTAHGDEMRPFEAPDERLFERPAAAGLAAQLAGRAMRVAPPAPRERRRDAQGRAVGVGKKKSAVARVLLSAGSGAFSCNGRSLVSYFPALAARSSVLEPLLITERLRNTDILANVHGGGTQGQAEAVRHAIARALERFDPEYRPVLKKANLLARDPRVVERKKPGKPKARKSFQWLKR